MTSERMTAEGSASITVLGAGNWQVGHDRVGPRVLELLAGRYGPEVELCDAGTAGLALLDHVRGQPLLIVVDAGLFGGTPGQIQVLEPDSTIDPGSVGSVHQIGPLEALWIVRMLYPEKMPRAVRLILVETDGIDDQVLEEACQQVVPVLDREIRAWRQSTDSDRSGSQDSGMVRVNG